MILSILTPFIEIHRESYTQLVKDLSSQYNGGDVELIYDNNETDATGTKRNRLLEKAKGKYIVFVDADDEVFPYYISEILKAAQNDCDCIATVGIMTTDGANQIEWRLSKDNPNTTIFENGIAVYLRTTNHISPVKRELALRAMFPDISNGEDKAYSERLNPLLKTECSIELPLYHYKYINRQKEYLR